MYSNIVCYNLEALIIVLFSGYTYFSVHKKTQLVYHAPHYKPLLLVKILMIIGIVDIIIIIAASLRSGKSTF